MSISFKLIIFFYSSKVVFDRDVAPQPPTVPWVPKSVRFNLAGPSSSVVTSTPKVKTPPNLLPISNHSLQQEQSSGHDGEDMLEAQIRINTAAMQEIEELRRERDEVLKTADQKAKENSILQAKLVKSTEKLDYLMKKVSKSSSRGGSFEDFEALKDTNEADTNDENVDPNTGNNIKNPNDGNYPNGLGA